MKVLIIPDLHNNYAWAEGVIDLERPDKVVFLGDYPDSYRETYEDVVNTAMWLKNSLQNPNRIHLVGNHDLYYATRLQHVICPGNNGVKLLAINNCDVPWELLKTHWWLDDWLLTHAGLTKPAYDGYMKRINGSGILDVTNDIGEDLDILIDEHGRRYAKKVHGLLHMIGESRGGSSDHGGILWCDYDEFIDIPNIRQIFGHTRDGFVRRTPGGSYCIDTGGNSYAVYENKEMRVKHSLRC